MTNTIITEALRIKAKTNAKVICLDVLGKPSSVTTHELRYGSRGSLCICVAGPKAGSYHNFETGKGGDMISLLSDELGGIGQALRYLSEDHGDTVSTSATVYTIPMPNQPKAKRWSKRAQSILAQTIPLRGTAGDLYLSSRKLNIPTGRDVRFMMNSPYQGCAAIVSRITDALDWHDYMSLHFIFVREDGSKAYPTDKQKKSNKILLKGHQSKGGVIRTTDDEEVELGLGLAEGLEDALAASQLTGMAVWSALSASNIAEGIPIINGLEHLTIFPDNDKAGANACEAIIKRYEHSGIRVGYVEPTEPYKDFNDELLGRSL